MALRQGFVCPLTWEDLAADGDRRRFCGSCRKVVYDLTDCGQDEVKALLAANGGRMCGRYRADLVRGPLAVAGALIAGAAFAGPPTGPGLETARLANVASEEPIEEWPLLMGDIVDPELEARWFADAQNREAAPKPEGT